ncbi:alpha/beta fold hydrolase [Candidatus Poribacteria bacterium]|nr:alpha/beta fold hydrolase [Candidatus Poribacteria bacterium]
MKTDENAVYRLNQHPEIPIQLYGRTVPVRYYTVEEVSPIATTENKGTILLVHGIRDNALYFERIARCFVSQGYRVFLLELPGYDAHSWGSPAQLDEYTISAFAEYLQHAIEALEAKHQIKRGEWIIWGPSMGGAIIYQAMAQNPAMFRQFDHIVLEVPAFASRLTFGAKFLIRLSEQLHKSAIGRAIGRKLIQSYHIIGLSTLALSTLLIALTAGHSLIWFFTLVFIAGIAIATHFVCNWAMIPDCIEVDELATGRRREGIYYGMWFFGQKVFMAMAIWVNGVVLSYVGYQRPETPGEILSQPPEALKGIQFLAGPLPALAILLSVIALAFYPITEKKFAEIKLRLQERTSSRSTR